MQNELLDPGLSHGLLQHLDLPPQPVSGPLSQTPRPADALHEKVDPNRARKVAEVFLTAGHAFQKLGDLAMQLHMGPSSLSSEEKWSESNVDHLREALTRFAHELDQISNNVQARTTKMISTDIRRKHMVPKRTTVASAVSALKRQPTKLGPVVVPKRVNIARNTRQYMPVHQASTSTTSAPQMVVPVTKAYPITRASTSAFAGQRQYVMSLPQAGPSRPITIATPLSSNQSGVNHQQNTNTLSYQGPPTLIPAVMEEKPRFIEEKPRLE
ncbi:hypothetical protein KIN20_012771 [Parelaphostrongylus tenuis]|uniref:Uncharacterized protein n=1 Tax=Parelaphostrongylus tenuis TaxID=148309 RepID=A0AAD5MFN0_PARTN|nr:hypothetical protein KIN20_012771 [Parelaphostrongylus tenuis]